jgi:hypothetical protein
MKSMKKVFFIAIICMLALNVSAVKIQTNYRNSLILAYSQANSVYEDENIKLEIYDEQLWATNKTSKTIFIDYAQCFAFHNGSSTSLYNPDDKKQGDAKASMLNLTTKNSEFLALAPNMGTKQNETKICWLTTRVYGKYSTWEIPTVDFTEYDKRLLKAIAQLVKGSNPSLNANQFEGTSVLHFTEDESINNIGVTIAYAFKKETDEWTTVSLSTWVCDVIFAPYWIEMPKELSDKEKRGFEYKETDPIYIHVRANSPFEFDEDKSPVLVCEWEGDYDDGTFKLRPTWIPNKNDYSAGDIFTSSLMLRPDIELYKHVIKFDGADSDWGKMTYADWADETFQK